MGGAARRTGPQAVTGGYSPLALLLVAAGGAAGSVLRYAISLIAISGLGGAFPWGTLAVNVIGSGAIGMAAAAGLEGSARLLLVTGFLGGFTTFSAFSMETGALYGRSPALAALYVTASLGLSLAAFALALWLMRR
jgi:CrcB protein